jgi:hypothetical protein
MADSKAGGKLPPGPGGQMAERGTPPQGSLGTPQSPPAEAEKEPQRKGARRGGFGPILDKRLLSKRWG